jgi:hypothetical protein
MRSRASTIGERHSPIGEKAQALDERHSGEIEEATT